MATQNSQKRSPRSSAKSKQESTGTTLEATKSTTDSVPFDKRQLDQHADDEYHDRSQDQVARVRAARAAARRRMEAFGDISEYTVTIIKGQLKDEPADDSQPSLDFSDGRDASKLKEGKQ